MKRSNVDVQSAKELLEEAIRLTISLKATSNENSLTPVVLDQLDSDLAKLNEWLQTVNESQDSNILDYLFELLCKIVYKMFKVI